MNDSTLPFPGFNVGTLDHLKYIVELNWNKELNESSCLSRYERKSIRNVLREFMKSMPRVHHTSKYKNIQFQLLLMKYIKENEYYKKLLKYDNEYFKQKYDQYVSTITAVSDISTVGKYIIYFVMKIIKAETIRKERFLEDDGENYDLKFISGRIKYACTELFWTTLAISNFYKCYKMFIGIPSYFFHNIIIQEVYDELSKYMMNDKENLSKYTVYNFLNYLTKNERIIDDTNKITLYYVGETWDFNKSVPEFVLEALCYSVKDLYKKVGTIKVLVYAYDQFGRYQYFMINKDDNGYVEKFPSFQNEDDISAIRINTPLKDSYNYRNTVVTSYECNELIRNNNKGEEQDEIIKEFLLTKIKPKHDEVYPKPKDNLIEDPPSPPPKDDDNINDIIKQINEFIKDLNDDRVTTNSLFLNILDLQKERFYRLEHHLETMRQFSLILTRKVDRQSNYNYELVEIPPHSLDKSIPRYE
ncbi:P4c precursor [Cetacean poxvirus 1]|nr:P4c precursor [Cetacean poxvirus 1]